MVLLTLNQRVLGLSPSGPPLFSFTLFSWLSVANFNLGAYSD